MVSPLISALAKKGISYTGCLYVGLMWGEQGPKVVEFNVRLGDPEAQVLAVADPRDWLAIMGRKAKCKVFSKYREKFPTVEFSPSVCHVLASLSYPYGEGEDQDGLLGADLFGDRADSKIFAGSVKSKDNSHFLPGQGRVLSVVSQAVNFNKACLANEEKIGEIRKSWNGFQFRKDVGLYLDSLPKS